MQPADPGPAIVTVGSVITTAQLAIIAPRTRIEVLEAILPAVQRMLDWCGCNTPARAAAILARVSTETEGFRLTKEEESPASGPGFAHYLGRHGNLTLADCLAYSGAGLLQLSFRDNFRLYTAWVQALGVPVDFEAHPELVLDARYLGLESAFYVATRPALVAAADRGDIDEVSTLVNADKTVAAWSAAHGGLIDAIEAERLNEAAVKAAPLGQSVLHRFGIYGLEETRQHFIVTKRVLGVV